MAGNYHDFFAASVGASAAFIGLLFVALTYANTGNVDEKTRTWRRIIASSSFSQLVDIFFVSMAGLLPDPHNAALVGFVMASIGLVVAMRLLPQATAYETTGRRLPTVLGLVAVAAYLLQLAASIGLLHYPNNQNLQSYFILAIIILYTGALARAWEITGIKKH